MHQLLEDAGKGRFLDGRQTTIDARWRELVDKAEQAMAAEPLERRFLPLHEHVPKFDVLRIRARTRAADLSQQIPGAEARDDEAAATPYGYELHVESGDGLIAGRIDRALPAPSGPILQDYKSGAIFVHGTPGELRPEYANQLRLYAALYHDATGVWPSKLELVPLVGEPHEITFTPSESLRLLAEARSLLAHVNEQLDRTGADWEAAETTLASPSARACRFCAYRPACSAYLKRDPVDEDRQWPADVWGRLKSLSRLGNGRLILSLLAGDGATTVFVRDISDAVAEAASLPSVASGTWVGAFNIGRTRSPRAFEERPHSAIYVGDPDSFGRDAK